VRRDRVEMLAVAGQQKLVDVRLDLADRNHQFFRRPDPRDVSREQVGRLLLEPVDVVGRHGPHRQ